MMRLFIEQPQTSPGFANNTEFKWLQKCRIAPIPPSDFKDFFYISVMQLTFAQILHIQCVVNRAKCDTFICRRLLMSQRFAQNMRLILETHFVTLSDYESCSGILGKPNYSVQMLWAVCHQEVMNKESIGIIW